MAGTLGKPDLGSSLVDWLDYIGRERPLDVNRGLGPVGTVARRLDLLPPAPRNLVVAGTNGKGSTCIFAETLLLALGYKVGTTISPHVLYFNERIRIQGQPVADADIVMAFNQVEAARADVALSYFEFAVLAAFWLFRRAAVDVCVLEVGLGGRLDAVNLVSADVTVITSIGLDHQALLGPDRESIAAEKAGILRASVPLVFGEAAVPEAVRTRAEELHAPLHVFGRDFGSHQLAQGWDYWEHDSNGRIALAGLPWPRLDPVNAAIAARAVGLLQGAPINAATLLQAVDKARFSGRFDVRQVRQRQLVLDVAHNPHGAAFLARQLAQRPCAGRTWALAGFFRDKDAAGILAELAAQVDEWILVDTRGERGQSGSVLLPLVPGPGPAQHIPTVSAALADALMRSSPDDRIILFGSFDVVEQACRWLQDEQD